MVTGKIMEVYRSCSNSFGSDKFIKHQNPWLLVKYNFTNPKWNIAKHKKGGLESYLKWRNISTMVMQSMTILPWHSACVRVWIYISLYHAAIFLPRSFSGPGTSGWYANIYPGQPKKRHLSFQWSLSLPSSVYNVVCHRAIRLRSKNISWDCKDGM